MVLITVQFESDSVFNSFKWNTSLAQFETGICE